MSTGQGVVVVVGSINRDLTVPVPRLPGPGETLMATGLRRTNGGKGANQAVASARAGGSPTVVIGAVGQDQDGAALVQALEETGVETSWIQHVGAPTGLAVITVDDLGENTIVVAPGANEHLCFTSHVRGAVGRAEVLLGQLEISQAMLAETAASRPDGATFVLNAAPSAPLSKALLAQVDVLIVNEHEATDLTAATGSAEAGELLVTLVPTVIVTLGGAGCMLHQRNRPQERFSAPRVVAVDTVAAGDTFCGVFAASLAQGQSIREAIELASVAASLAVQHQGAQESIPRRAEVLESMGTARSAGGQL